MVGGSLLLWSSLTCILILVLLLLRCRAHSWSPLSVHVMMLTLRLRLVIHIPHSMPLISVHTNVSSARKSAASAPGEIEAFLEEKAVVNTCKQLEDEIKKLGLRIKRHEDKIKSLMRERNETCEAIQDLQVTLSQFHILERPMTERGYLPNAASELVKVHHIRKNENSAAGNLSELITSHGTKAFHNLQNCGVVGTVATLGKVDDGNISREEPQIIFPECSGTSGPPADYASLEEQIRKKGLEWKVLQEELQREVACLDNVKSEFLVKKKEYLQFLDEASPQCAGSAVQVPAHSED